MSRKVTREHYVAMGAALLSQGIATDELTIDELSGRLEVSKGSFYSHFRDGGLAELYREVITRWLRDTSAGLGSPIGAVSNPLDRLRLLRARAVETATTDATMRRWAFRDADAAAAVAQVDAGLSAHARQAVADLGFPPDEAAALTEVFLRTFFGGSAASPGARPQDPAMFEAFLTVGARAAVSAVPAEGEGPQVGAASGADGDVVLFAVTTANSPEVMAELQGLAQRFATKQAAAQAPETGPRPDRDSAAPPRPPRRRTRTAHASG